MVGVRGAWRDTDALKVVCGVVRSRSPSLNLPSVALSYLCIITLLYLFCPLNYPVEINSRGSGVCA
jgi:hypothetical protein